MNGTGGTTFNKTVRRALIEKVALEQRLQKPSRNMYESLQGARHLGEA